MKKEYYIQGDPARAEEIKAAFEAKGIDTTAINVGDEDWLYFSSNGLLYFEEFSNTLLNIFKTHPDYAELPLPAMPEFDVGDWIVRGSGFVYEPSLITEIRDYYICELQNGERVTYTLNDVHKNFHLWTVQDAKSGDVLACSDWLFILKQFNVKGNKHKTYCHYDLTLKRFKDDNDSYMVTGSDEFHPATKEQRDLLFQKMKEADYVWDNEKKKLRKIKSNPDYQELELPTKPKPKFKVGDWIANDYCAGKVIALTDDAYLLDSGQGIPFSCEHNAHLWTIEDAKDGDVLAADECYVIFKEIDGLNIKCYCTYHYMGFNPSFHIDTLQNKTAFHPATKEQREVLFDKMKGAGYQWDEKKKELRKIIKPKFKIGDWLWHKEKVFFQC